jgi:hypothetical protein
MTGMVSTVTWDWDEFNWGELQDDRDGFHCYLGLG